MADWRMCCLTIIENAVVELADFEITTEIYKALFEGKARLDEEYMAKDDHDLMHLYYYNFPVPYNTEDVIEYFFGDMDGLETESNVSRSNVMYV